MPRVAHSGVRVGLPVLGLVLVFTLASALAINPYSYGSGDNAITIPFVKASLDPALYPGDYLLAQRPFYYTYLWNALGLLHARLDVSLPVLFFGTYLVALYVTFLGMYLVGLALFEHHEVAILSLLFVLFSKATLGGVQTLEQTLNTREVATPLLMLALFHFLEGRALPSFLLLGLAYLVHPLTSHYVLAMLIVAALVDSRRGGLRALRVGIPAFLVVASPILVWSARRSPASLHPFSADPQWLVALRERSSPHMFPFAWDWTLLVHTLVTLALFGIAWRTRNVNRDDRHRVIWIAAWTIVAWCLIGVVGSELYPVGIVFLLQPLRAFQFMEYFAMLYVAHYLYRQIADSKRLGTALGSAVIAGWIAFGAQRQAIALLVLIGVVAVMVTRRWAWYRAPGGVALATTATCLACLAAWACFAVDRSAGDTTFSIVDDSQSLFVDVEHWARVHTNVRDGFIVPPYVPEEFRVQGERTVYADIEDGGLMNSNPAFGREWLRRMAMLGFANPRSGRLDDTVEIGPARRAFCGLGIVRLRAIAREMRATSRRVFLVWPCSKRALPLPRRYRNAAYVVYELP